MEDRQGDGGAVSAIVVAGGLPSAEFAAEAGIAVRPGGRALAEICGRPMVSYVLRALREATCVDRVVLAAPSGFPPQADADVRVAADGELPENILAALEHCQGSEFVLIVTADIPFATAEAIDDYVRRSLETGAECCYAAIPEKACLERFPGTKRTCLRTPEMSVTGGNLVLLRTECYPRMVETLRAAYRGRKSPVFLARLIGLGNVLKFLTGRLTLRDVEVGASRITGVRTRLVVTPYAELGTDVDKPADLQLARAYLQPRD